MEFIKKSNKKYSKKIVALTLLLAMVLILVFSFTGCAKQSFSDNILGTTLEVELKGKNTDKIYKEIFSAIENIEKRVSPTVEYSDINRLNKAMANEYIPVRQITIDLIKIAKDVYNKSNGAFNPTTYSLVELWKFSPDTYKAFDTNYKIPTNEEIQNVLAYSNNFDMIEFNEENKTLLKTNENVKIDLGGIAKGYCAELGYNILKENDVEYGYINLGGNIYTYNADVKIHIKDPRFKENISKNGAENTLGNFYLNNSSIATSGDYERCHIVDDVRYHHIIDPKTGKPSNSDVISCSVISTNGALADAVATSVVILGSEKGIELLKQYDLKAIIVTNKKQYKVVNDLTFSYNENLVVGYEKI